MVRIVQRAPLCLLCSSVFSTAYHTGIWNKLCPNLAFLSQIQQTACMFDGFFGRIQHRDFHSPHSATEASVNRALDEQVNLAESKKEV